jgi:hypothetical protein
VRATVDSSTVTFRETCKTFTYPARLLSRPLGNDMLAANISFEQLSSIRSVNKILRLNICNPEESEETTIVFNANEKAEADYNDAAYFGGSQVSLASLSADKKKLAINFMPELHQIEYLKLSVNAAVSGSYNLKFTEVPKSSVAIFLKDSLLANQLIEVNDTLVYPFAIDRKIPETYGDYRFSLIFKEKPTNGNTSVSRRINILAFPNPANTEVFFDGSSLPQINKRILIYDLLGKKKQILSFKTGDIIRADLSLIEPGLYIAEFISDWDGKFLGESLFVKY